MFHLSQHRSQDLPLRSHHCHRACHSLSSCASEAPALAPSPSLPPPPPHSPGPSACPPTPRPSSSVCTVLTGLRSSAHLPTDRDPEPSRSPVLWSPLPYKTPNGQLLPAHTPASKGCQHSMMTQQCHRLPGSFSATPQSLGSWSVPPLPSIGFSKLLLQPLHPLPTPSHPQSDGLLLP